MAESITVVDTLDTIGANAASIPNGTKRVLAYITGSGGIAWTSAQIDALTRKGVQFVARIDQTNTVLSLTSLHVLIKDVEPGASTNLTADHESAQRARLGLRTTLYCMLSDFEPLKASVNALGIASHVDYFVADWNLDRAQAIAFIQVHPEVVGVQYASPSSNPHTILPGSKRTLSQANVDLSVTRADWPTAVAPQKRRLPKPKLPAALHPKVTATGIAGALTAALLGYLNSHGAHVTSLNPEEASVITLSAGIIAGYLTPAKKK